MITIETPLYTYVRTRAYRRGEGVLEFQHTIIYIDIIAGICVLVKEISTANECTDT